jgi:GntR family transcriptional regulator, transcriptional repressor for pyruvate dehydrogenase complex
MGLKPIKKRRLFEEIIIAIEEYIEEEKISAGERLPSENDLANLFQVSKTAVREAMSVLQANGIIEKRSGAGIFLTELHGETIAGRVTSHLLSQKDYREILEFRRGLEVEAAALAAVNATEEDLKAIREAQKKLLEAHTTGRLGLEEDYLFHYSIILASHNSIYKEVFDNVADKFEEGMRISKLQSSKVPGRFVEVYEEHNDILDGLKSRDPKRAADAMRNHLIQNEKKLWSNHKVKKEPI